MKLFRFLGSRTFLFNIVLAIALFLLLIWLVQKWMGGVTDHGEVVTVPDLTTYSLEEVEEVLDPLNLKFAVLDSSEFSTDVPPGSVVGQYPEADAEVKENRTIQLTLNSMYPRMIEVPDVIDIPNQDARHRLESRGFNVGKIRYIPDLGKDNVLFLEVNGKEIASGSKLRKGSTIDMVLGMGLSNQRVAVPHLNGLTVDQARATLQTSMLNLRAVLYDEEIGDTATALIYRQSPMANPAPVIRMGDGVDVWVTNDHTKLAVDTLDNHTAY